MIKQNNPKKIKFTGTILSLIILLNINVDSHNINEYIQLFAKKFMIEE